MTDSRYPATIHIEQALIDKIDRPIDPAVISSRPGNGNTTQAFLKGDIIADQLNAVFGPLGWSKASRIHSVDDWEEEKNVTRNNQSTLVNMKMVQVISDVTLTIKKTTADGTDTVFVEQGVGYGEVEAGKSRKEAFGMAVKGASTDGLKRCSSLIGKAFGMMMASNGQQEDVQYAHNGKTNELKKAREIRAGGKAPLAEHDRGGQQFAGNRQNGGTNGQRGGNEGGANGGGQRARVEDRPRQAAQANDAAPGKRQGGETQDEKPARTDDTVKPVTNGSAKEGNVSQQTGTAAGRTRREPDTNYPLESVPVTKDDQTDFAATLYARTKGMRQKNDKDGLVRQHLNTIRNLDGAIRKHLCTRLGEEGVDVDRL